MNRDLPLAEGISKISESSDTNLNSNEDISCVVSGTMQVELFYEKEEREIL